MSEQKTVEALVLRRRDVGEADRRLTLLTREDGRMNVIARGARKAASRLAAISEPLTLGEFHVATGTKQAYVLQASIRDVFPGLRADYNRLTLALGLAEVYAAFTQGGVSHEDEFDSLVNGLHAIEVAENTSAAAVWALLRALDIEGVAPYWLHYVDTEGEILETPCYVSPSAGGPVTFEVGRRTRDAYLAKVEVLIGLQKTSELSLPPPKLRMADEALKVLFHYLCHVCHDPLPALRVAVGEQVK